MLSAQFRKFDALLMRLMDALMAFPAILLAIGLTAALGPHTSSVIIALSVAYIPRTARIVRASALVTRELEFVEAARVAGASGLRIMLQHLLPNAIGPLLVQSTFVFAYAILAEAALSFLGVGPPPPTPSWGNIIAEGRDHSVQAWWIMLFPGHRHQPCHARHEPARRRPARRARSAAEGRDMSNLLEIDNLTVQFRGDAGWITAIDDVSLDLREGETLGIVGESGSGKSVTALSILRLHTAATTRHPTGRIVYAGKDMLALTPPQLRAVRGREIAMIFQDPMSSLNPVLTIADQISETLRLHQGLDAAASRQRAIELLDLVRIPDARRRVDEYPHRLSGGMRQRVMIAIAIACRPRLLIADEPTTALDVTIQAQILDLLRELQSSLGMSVILISHDMGVIAEFAQRVVVMYAGRIVETAPVKDLFRQAVSIPTPRACWRRSRNSMSTWRGCRRSAAAFRTPRN